jgi:hypothetical protein
VRTSNPIQRKEVRNYHNAELHNLYTSPNVTGIFESRSMRRGRVELIEEARNVCRLLVGNPEEKRLHLGGLAVDKGMVKKLIQNKYSVRLWPGFNWLRIGSSGGLL